MKRHLYIFLFFLSLSSFGQGFLHRNGQKIVNGSGYNVILRGLGLGGWMIQEGYMLKTADSTNIGPQHVIKQKITELIGAKNTEEFYNAYKSNGITKKDIDSLAAWGFNSIRLPMHFNLYTLPIELEKDLSQNTWLEEGFKMTDDLLNWCAANKIYLILDLHGAPGGQGRDANISDYDPLKPSLWESTANQDKMVALWVKIALRYKDSPWIGGYDIINEPNWNFDGKNKNGCDETSNAPLWELQTRITKAIREVDANHLIFIEGNCWGNNYNGMPPLWDENIALSFHKYWNPNNTESIQKFMDMRTQYNVPIWLGETGENSNVWFKDVISLAESNNIGWAFWPMKKIDNIAGITSVATTPEYEKLLQYWKKGGEKPSSDFAKAALTQIAENYKLENVTIKRDVIDAMFRQVQTTETKMYKKHSLPGIIFATEYDLGQNGYAYFDNVVANYNGTAFTKWNKGAAMRNDGVDIKSCNDTITNGFNVCFIDDNEWLQFTIDLNSDNEFDVDIRYSNAVAGGKLYLEDENGKISKTISIPFSADAIVWKTVTLKNVALKQGINKVKVHFKKGNFDLNYLEFKNAQVKGPKK
ncbi:cellulase family glycosylhydrolase [Flavobacterium cellulosilyticum]|uniref:Glycosyl hydrolase family 5 n=1 Tax=Flavobacterium cellulosilyticum TaxID=2541731 RepID=A0A4R5CBB7_9FLAO|nr:cellulase family glycosylhydrolase [Flavobacterium cellulosilyticum]TDD95520.1 glycosyl hydrolase family 5 [Flavobacterium cellulosilyticum]